MNIDKHMIRFLLCSGWLFGFGVAAGPAADQPPLARHYRSLPPPKVLLLGGTCWDKEELRAITGAEVTFGKLLYDHLDFHHLCDKPLEETKEDVAFVNQEGQKFLEVTLARLKSFDVVIAALPPQDNPMQRQLVQYVRGGGRLVFVNPGWETTFEGTPLAEVLPVKFDGHTKAWIYDFQGATDHPLTRGLPFEIAGFHWYGPVYQPADDSCVPLTRNSASLARNTGSTQFWYRRLPEGGQVVHLFQVSGSKWQWYTGTSYASYAAERPDDSALWQAFQQRLIYWLTYGDKAFPVLTKIVPPPSSTNFAVAVELESRFEQAREVLVRLTVSTRRDPRQITAAQRVTLKAGEKTSVAFPLDTSLPCVDSYLQLRAEAGDTANTEIFSESTAWIPFTHQVSITVQTDQRSYRSGEPIHATAVCTNAATLGNHSITLCIVDHLGRTLQVATNSSALFVMPDGGPEQVASYWVTALVHDGERILGTARTQLQLDDPWDMRRRMEWSVWTAAGDARTIALFRDGGFNALGLLGNSAAADRFGLRQYVESAGGINTFGVTIDHDNWDAVRTAMDKQMAGAEVDARSKSLVSLGEESGFANGWGTRYYWKEDKAPPVAQKVFDDYLAELYAGKIEDLNAEWGAGYKSFAEIPLERRPMGGRVFVGAQAWAALTEEAKKNAAPVELVATDPKQKYMARTAPAGETYAFFDWYYQKYCDLATQAYRTKRNPVPLTMMSAPGGFYPQVDVYNFNGQGPFYPKEAGLVRNAIARRDYGDGPGFSGALWAYFDLHALWSSTVLSYLLAGNTHMDYWVDFPLTFNADATHTRASFWTKDLTRRLRPIQPILLHKRFVYTRGLDLFIPRQPLGKGLTSQHFNSAIDCNAPLYSALEESGCLPRVVKATDLGDTKVLIASHAQVVSSAEGRQLTAFVKNGGLLIATPWLAACSPHGNMLSVYPAPETGLADLLGFKLLNTSQQATNENVTLSLNTSLGIPHPLTVRNKGRDQVLEMAPDVQVLGKYADGTPLLLSRQVGRGRVVYLNFIYDWEGWWNSFYEPPREAYRQLINALIRRGELVRPDYFIGFQSATPVTDNRGWWVLALGAQPQPGESVPWWASQLYSDPTGTIKYLAVFADHRSPLINAQVTWKDPHVRITDLLHGGEVPLTDGRATLTLRPGDAAFWAIVPKRLPQLRVSVPARVQAGQPITVTVKMPGAPRAVCGFVVDVFDPSGAPSPVHSLASVNATNGTARVAIPTARNDEEGTYRVVVTASLTRQQTEARFQLTRRAADLPRDWLNPFPPRAGDRWPIQTMSDAQFLGDLRRLRDIYDGTFTGLDAKYMLSYYLYVPFRPDNRHAILRRLQRVDWTPHLHAVGDALRAGETFYLLGEDLNLDPETGLTIDPLAASDPAGFLAQLAKLPGAELHTRGVENLALEVINIGKGAMVVCRAASVDRAAYHSSDFIAWHQTLKAVLSKRGGN